MAAPGHTLLTIELYGSPVIDRLGYILFPGVLAAGTTDVIMKRLFVFAPARRELIVFKPVEGLGSHIIGSAQSAALFHTGTDTSETRWFFFDLTPERNNRSKMIGIGKDTVEKPLAIIRRLIGGNIYEDS